MTLYLSSWLLSLSERRVDQCTCPLSNSVSVCRSTRANTSSRYTYLSSMSVHSSTCPHDCLTCPPVPSAALPLCAGVPGPVHLQHTPGCFTRLFIHLFICTPGCLTCLPDHLFACTPVCQHVYLNTCIRLSHLSVCLSCYLFVSMWGFPQSDHLQGTPDCLTCLPSHLLIWLTCVFYVSHLCLFWSPVSLAVLCMLILNN